MITREKLIEEIDEVIASSKGYELELNVFRFIQKKVKAGELQRKDVPLRFLDMTKNIEFPEDSLMTEEERRFANRFKNFKSEIQFEKYLQEKTQINFINSNTSEDVVEFMKNVERTNNALQALLNARIKNLPPSWYSGKIASLVNEDGVVITDDRNHPFDVQIKIYDDLYIDIIPAVKCFLK